MGPLGLSDLQMHELMQAAQSVPSHLRHTFLQRVAEELRGKTLGDGLVHRVAHSVAKALAWDADRFLVALSPSKDLFFGAKHLFIAAMNGNFLAEQ